MRLDPRGVRQVENSSRARRGGPRGRPCPNCGAVVPPRALACPECGSDERTGWADDDEIETASLDLPDLEMSDEDYEDFLARDLGERPRRRAPLWILIVVVLTVLALLLASLW